MEQATAKADSPTLAALKALHPQRASELLESFAAVIEGHEREQREPVAWIVTKNGQLLVFRRPDQDEWEDAGDRLRRGERVAVVHRELAMQCVLEPKADDMPAVFKRWPGLHSRIGDAFNMLTGASEELVAKKD